MPTPNQPPLPQKEILEILKRHQQAMNIMLPNAELVTESLYRELEAGAFGFTRSMVKEARELAPQFFSRKMGRFVWLSFTTFPEMPPK